MNSRAIPILLATIGILTAANLPGGIGSAAAQTQDTAVSNATAQMHQLEITDNARFVALYEGVAMDGTLDPTERAQFLSMVEGEDSTATVSVRAFEAAAAEHKTLGDDHPQATRAVDARVGFDVGAMIDMINAATASVKKKFAAIQGTADQISIVEMFEMQMLMNNLSQLSEMSTSIVSASNSAISSMARNVKS
jgi:hypothetical protein